jgi:hypothetical protein
MPIVARNALLSIVLLFFAHSSSSQTAGRLEAGNFRNTAITLAAADTIAYLSHHLIVKNSEVLLLDSVLLVAGIDYVLDDRFGVIRFLPDRITELRKDTTRQYRLEARYQVFPFTLQERYQRRELIVREDTALGPEARVARPTSTFSVDDLFGADLQKSGSIVRGFTVGSNRDLSLTSGFRMQMAGKIASDVEVVAALTDENTPIQPEGNTQTLQEIDKVFVEIRSTDLSATLGDFNLEFGGNEFGLYRRKLQGAKGVANYRADFANGSAVVSGAVNRGKFHTNEFQGIEGVQGPYRLNGQNNERNIIIIAGTEKVFVSGESMTRGESNDYVIDYASGEVVFTSRRLITGFSRIVVDFEYTDRQFTRNLLAAKAGTNLLQDRVRVNLTMIREADDQDAPIDLSLSDADKDLLRNAGGDRFKASRSGVDSVGGGKGQYVAEDTTVNGVHTRVYRFAPTDPAAAYNVFFSFVGAGSGDYVKVSVGNFRYAGPSAGSYLPIRFLPLPQMQTLTDVDVDARVTDDLSISGEYAVSRIDVNRFSTLDDVNNQGPAMNLGLRYTPKNVRVGEMNVGSFDLGLRERFVDGRFAPIDRTNDVEFNRRWNLEQVGQADEEIREGSLLYRPVDELSLRGELGRITRGEFTSDRSEVRFGLAGDRLPSLAYALESISSRDNTLDSRGRWIRQRGDAEYSVDQVTPGFRYENEDRRAHSLNADTLKYGSFRFNEFSPRVVLKDVWNMALTTEFSWRLGDSLLAGTLQRESETFTQQYGWRLREWNSLSSTIDVTLRKKQFTEPFRLRGNGDVETILLRFQGRYTPLARGVETDLFYEAATQRASKLERVFVRVPQGTGTLRYLGDDNGNGIIDEADFAPDRFDGDFVATTVPSDDLFPIVDLKASTRLRVSPVRFLTPDTWLTEALSALSTETYVRVEEKSVDPDTRNIYYLRLSRFLDDRTTILGSNYFSQDIHVFENRPAFSLRFRYTQRNGFAQFALVNERSYVRERSVRVRWQLIKEFLNQTEYTLKNDRAKATQPTGRSRDIISNSVTSDWSYRPEQNIELGFTVGVGRSVDSDSLPPTTADLNTQGVRLVYSFQEKGQARAELQREEVQLDRSRLSFPFELTGGRIPGKTWLWRVAFEYRLTQFVQTSVGYDGRSEGRNAPIHTARAEVRAFF